MHDPTYFRAALASWSPVRAGGTNPFRK